MFWNKEKGFTLIELLIIVAILGILAAIAIPQFAAYRVRGFNATSLCDLRNMITAQEAYYADTHQRYTDAMADLLTYGYTQSSNVQGTVMMGSPFSYQMQAFHASGDCTWKISGPLGAITK